MADVTGNAKQASVEQTLQDVMDNLGKKGALKYGKKILIISLDDTDDNYDVSFNQAGMSCSECLSLLRITETVLIEEMGY